MNNKTIIEVKNLRTYFETDKGLTPAVDGVSWNIESGKILGLVGESGCGKSMSALSVVGLVPKPFGRIMEGSEILFEGKDLTKLSNKEMSKVRGNEISMIFQEPMTSLNPVYTIGKQLTEPLLIHNKISKREAKDIALHYLEIVKVPDPHKRFNVYPHQLSGGLRQRIMIAMALICKPKLLIADEPTTALDVTIQAQILDLMKDLQRKTNTSILYISHNLGVIAEICDEICVMYAGQIIEKANVFDLFKNPLHPYTNGLLKSLPKVNEDLSDLYSIKGMVPSLSNLPKGCRFAPRCPEAKDICFKKAPNLIDIDSIHSVRCWKYNVGQVKNNE